MAQSGGLHNSAFGLAPEVEIDEECGGGFVVAYQVSHKDIEDVMVYANGRFWHGEQYNGGLVEPPCSRGSVAAIGRKSGKH